MKCKIQTWEDDARTSNRFPDLVIIPHSRLFELPFVPPLILAGSRFQTGTDVPTQFQIRSEGSLLPSPFTEAKQLSGCVVWNALNLPTKLHASRQ
jgi:hypothetical protein